LDHRSQRRTRYLRCTAGCSDTPPPPGNRGRRQKSPSGAFISIKTVTVYVSDTTLTIEFDDGDIKIITRTTTRPVRSIKGQRPRTATSVPNLLNPEALA
jgi:hypothetical protein